MADTEQAPSELLELRIYVAGRTPNSALALANLESLLTGRSHRLEVIDVLADPDLALDEGIHVTPTLVRLAPAPETRIIGSLGNTARAKAALGLP
jgi:circadian clock protein KaiB